MKWRSANTVFRKELLDTLRDKRTLLMMVGVPLVLYPALMIFGLQAAMVQQTKLEESTATVTLTGPNADFVREWLENVDRLEFSDVEDPDAALASGEVDAVVVTPPSMRETLAGGGKATIEIRVDASEYQSNEAADRVRNRLNEVSREYRTERLAAQGLDQDYIEPVAVSTTNTATAKKTTGTLLGTVLPLIVVLMITMGAFYPAIDLTAGEKERGTFETLLSTPLSTTEIVTGKFLAVLTLALIAGLLNIGSMALTMLFVLRQVSSLVETTQQINFEVPYIALGVSVLVLIPLALLVCALMMSVSVLARNFKDAQNFMTPVLLIAIFPSMLAIMPTMEINSFNQFIPFFNVVLLFKELLRDKAGADAVFAVVFSTAIYAGLALQLAVWLFQREEVVLSEELGLPLSFRRSEFLPRETLPAGVCLGWFCITTLLLFYAGGPLQEMNLLPGLFLTQWGVLLAPTLFLLWFVRVNFRASLHLSPLKLGYAAGSVLLAFSALILLMQLSVWHNKVLPVPSYFEEAMKGLFEGGDTWYGLLLLLGIVALSPAICEELIFRGVILSGLRRSMRDWQAALLTGLLFGLIHLSVYRLLGTALLGVLLSYLVIRSGSIFAGMLAHFINNATAILITTGRLPENIAKLLNIEGVEESGLPPFVFAGAAAVFILGLIIVEFTHRYLTRKA